MSISAMKQALEALEKLWDIIDDIDTYSDMAKNDDKLYRSLVERRQRQRFEQTGISTDGYELNGGAIAALRQAIEFEEMVKKGTKAWSGTPDDWVDELRGGAEKREWVGLTDEDICQLRREGAHEVSDKDFRSIEAKLKEKNS